MYGELKLALFIYLWYPKTKVKIVRKRLLEEKGIFILFYFFM